MNNRKRKRLKVSRKSFVDEKIHQIFDLCLKINGIEARREEKTGKLPTVFFHFSGHTAGVEVDIHLEGWSKSSYEDYLSYEFYLSGALHKPSEVEECYNKLKEIYESMEESV